MEFRNKISELYNIILQPIDSTYKKFAVQRYKKEINIDKNFGNKYYQSLAEKKSKGVVYTPHEISQYIIKNTIEADKIIENPYYKICDPSCGSGNILIECYRYLKNLFIQNLHEINRRNKLFLNEKDIDKHILNYNIYGFDIDETALKILVIDMFDITGHVFENTYCKDFLLEHNEQKFDYLIGNPPYVGQKSIDKDYSKILKEIYKDVYKDKGDLSYCFFKKALNNLNDDGCLGFITSRYFLEAPSGKELRRILNEECTVNKIVDFYGIRPFKGIGIDPVIIFLSKKVDRKGSINVIKPFTNIGNNKKEFYNSLFFKDKGCYREFDVDIKYLNNDGWILIDEVEREIIRKIEAKCNTTLMEICESYQGIITGCDKAFIVNDEIIEKECIETDIIKPWIKSSCIEKNTVNRQNMYIIYSDLIKRVEEYPNALKYIRGQKQRLMNRRECKKGYREWYELQWGRKFEIFEGEKIVFPYKSKNNRFAFDKNSYFSADVYCLILKNKTVYSYDFLLFLLNSKLYEFYFKTFGKKLGEDIYEYYPNTFMRLKLPEMFEVMKSNDEELFSYFELTEKEIERIES